jgi:transposase
MSPGGLRVRYATCMGTEGLVVKQREMRRHELLSGVIAGGRTLAHITPALGVSYRQAKRLKAKVEREGLLGLLHANRGRPAPNRADPALRARVLALSRERYFDCNDTHFAELLASREQIVLSRETVRRWRREEGFAPKRTHSPPKHRKRRPRKEAEGLMMLWDGSPHHWFGEEQPACCLMAAIDDATGKVLGAHCCPAETSWAYLKLLAQVLAGWGVPASVYQDRHGTLKRNDDCWSLAEELAGRQRPTQVGAALEALGIQPIFALSPQAKGRIERLFGTLQDRLVVSLRLAGISTIARANDFLPGFLEAYNARFAIPAAASESVWREPPKRAERERILSLCYPAKVGNDNAVRLDGMVLDIPPGPGKRSYARESVAVRQLLDGRWRVYHRERVIAEAPATEIAELTRTRRRRRGIPAAHDDVWVFLASKPSAAELEQLEALGAGRPAATLRRAGPGGVIKATRMA